MDFVIKPMETEAEILGKAFVHRQSWQEAYAGLIDSSFLSSLTPERFEALARRPGNVLIAKDGERVVGFVSFGPCRDSDLPDAGEVYAIYILASCYDTGVGHRLMTAALEELASCPQAVVWVLRGNERAIRFYQRCGFRFDGCQREILLGSPVTELRMALDW